MSRVNPRPTRRLKAVRLSAPNVKRAGPSRRTLGESAGIHETAPALLLDTKQCKQQVPRRPKGGLARDDSLKQERNPGRRGRSEQRVYEEKCGGSATRSSARIVER
jgi:hypothetical protein